MSDPITPADSTSNTGSRRKNRPGKNARMAARQLLPGGATATTAPASRSDASFFSSQAPSDPIPQPGRYPVVFQAMGEPSTEVAFAYDPNAISDIAQGLQERYIFNPRYAEFSRNAGYTDELFNKDLVRMFLLSLAQQTVHAHVNMGLTMGDLSPLASSDAFVLSSLKAVVEQFGEFSSQPLGMRFTLVDYYSTVTALVRSAYTLRATDDWEEHIDRMWIPTKKADKRTAFIVACGLARYVESNLGMKLNIKALAERVFTEEYPLFEAVKGLLPGDDSRFDVLFTGYVSQVQFANKFTSAAGQGLLTELGLKWEGPAETHLHFDLVPKVEFPELLDTILRKKPAFQQFLSITSGLRDRTQAAGSLGQVSEVTTDRGITVVKTHVAMLAPEESLLACFPPSGMFEDVGPLAAVETTPIAVALRATEFLQLDWVG